MLFVDHVTKKFNDTIVLDDITLEFENGVYGLLSRLTEPEKQRLCG